MVFMNCLRVREGVWCCHDNDTNNDSDDETDDDHGMVTLIGRSRVVGP